MNSTNPVDRIDCILGIIDRGLVEEHRPEAKPRQPDAEPDHRRLPRRRKALPRRR